MLSDIRHDRIPVIVEDTSSIEVAAAIECQANVVDTCKEGVTCIVDYSDSTMRGMSHFYAILDSIEMLDRPVRVAFFGDSFIEGDIFTADLRELLQAEFGGKGVGWVDITSNVSNFRPTVLHKYHGWESFNVLDSLHDNALSGINTSYYLPASQESYVELEGTSRYSATVKDAELSSIYFFNDCDTMLLSCSVNGSLLKEEAVTQWGFNVKTIYGNISKVRWTLRGCPNSAFWGVTMESRRGVVVDNFSLRGSSGLNFLSIPSSRLRQFASWRKYDLIVLQYGQNVVSRGRTNYSGYKHHMENVIKKLKDCFPNTSMLLFSVGDRMVKDDYGNLVTMPEVCSLAEYQEAIAADANIAFWDLLGVFNSLGGISSFAKSTPPMANLDYTHINFNGGKSLAKEFFEALVYGKEQYDKKHSHDAN